MNESVIEEASQMVIALGHERKRQSASRAATFLASIGLVVAACGGGATSTGTGAAQVDVAKARVAAAEAPQQWKAPGPPFDGTKAKGKTVWYIQATGTVPFSQQVGSGIAAGLATVGVNLEVRDGKSEISEEARLVEQAITQKADAIVILGIVGNTIPQALIDAKNAGIPVIAAYETDPGLDVTGDPPGAIVDRVGHSHADAGKLMADYLIADSGGKADAVEIWAPQFLTAHIEVDGTQSELKALCPQCKFSLKDVNMSSFGPSLSTITQSIIRSDPNVNYILLQFDGMALFSIPAVHEANAQNKVKVITFNGTPAVLQFIKNRDTLVADVGSAAVWGGWGIADEVLRVLTGNQPTSTIYVPERMFDSTNVDGLDLSASESSWYGNQDFTSLYRSNWGA